MSAVATEEESPLTLLEGLNKGVNLPPDLTANLAELFEGDDDGLTRVSGIIGGTRKVLDIIDENITPDQKKSRAELTRLASDPEFYAGLVELMDRFSRPGDTRHMAEQAEAVMAGEAFDHMKGMEQALRQLFLKFGVALNKVTVPRMVSYIKKNAGKFILINKGDVGKLGKKIAGMRGKTGIDYTVNIVSEDAHGQRQANRNIELCKAAIQNKDIHSIAVKPTSICPNVTPYAFDKTVERLKDAMVILLEEIKANPIGQNEDGTPKYKTIAFDMEDSSTMEVTIQAFKAAMREVPDVPATIAVQAYMPETVAAIDDLAKFSEEDMAAQGLAKPRVGVRLVKGANMPLERRNHELNASLSPVFEGKIFTDANYQYCLDRLTGEHAGKLRVKVGSMNVKDLLNAYGLVVDKNLLEFFDFEMLLGMAAEETLTTLASLTDNLAGAERLKGKLSAYTPVIIEQKGEPKKWLESLAYLIRRLQEIRMSGCFLNALLTKDRDSQEWKDQELAFARAYKMAHDNYGQFVEDYVARIKQNRQTEEPKIEEWTRLEQVMPCPVTNWRFKENRWWLKEILWECENILAGEVKEIEAEIGDSGKHKDEQADENFDDDLSDCTCPARNGKVFARFEKVSVKGVRKMYEVARDEKEWAEKSLEERISPITQAILAVQKNRGNLVGAGMLDTAFSGDQIDGEVSEMVEMYYAAVLSARTFRDEQGYEPCPKGDGVLTVSCPWNFPLAIPWNGIINGLIAGNRVIVKPAPETEYATYQIVKLLWEAGVPKDVLQFAPCGIEATAELGEISNNIVLTGHSNTAGKILENDPYTNLTAETGGNNAKFVGASADLDLVASTTFHELAGKFALKCSATRIMVVLDGVDLKALLEKVKDAVECLKVGADTISRENLDIDIGPMLLAAKRLPIDYDRSWLDLHDGEEWLIEPKTEDGITFTPGVKICHGITQSCQREEFAPVLKIVFAKDIQEGCAMINALGYALTSDYIGLDPDERDEYHENIIAGVEYDQRTATGANGVIVPFGGVLGTLSKFGGGAHAAGPDYSVDLSDWKKVAEPNYVARIEGSDNSDEAQLVRKFQRILGSEVVDGFGGGDKDEIVRDLGRLVEAGTSYIHNNREHFSKGFRPKKIEGQENHYEYMSFGEVVVRLGENDSLYNIVAPLLAHASAGNKVRLSVPTGGKMREKLKMLRTLGLFSAADLAKVQVVHEEQSGLARFLEENSRKKHQDRVKGVYYSNEADARKEPEIAKSAAKNRVWLRRGEFLENGRLALVSCLQGVTVCNVYDRFGNTPKRAFVKEAA